MKLSVLLLEEKYDDKGNTIAVRATQQDDNPFMAVSYELWQDWDERFVNAPPLAQAQIGDVFQLCQFQFQILDFAIGEHVYIKLIGMIQTEQLDAEGWFWPKKQENS